MELLKFKELLIDIAVCAIACDGDIDEREINALHKIEKDSPYFSVIDLSTTLDKSLNECKNNFNSFKADVFSKLENNNLNVVQELTVLEISLRIIAADEIEEESEKSFINELRSYLKLEDFLIAQRFGEISYLKPKVSEFNDRF
ncbi:tellurite resistance TerB family protein [Winogradskyella sp.]|nr:tellurite resistance TerB family protein [Winogradskyella sp.]